jgi:hypothetical protein
VQSGDCLNADPFRRNLFRKSAEAKFLSLILISRRFYVKLDYPSELFIE